MTERDGAGDAEPGALYRSRVVLPGIASAALLLAALALLLAPAGRIPALEATYFAAWALGVVAVGLYLVVGYWLHPTALLLAALELAVAHQWILDAASTTTVGGVGFLFLGFLLGLVAVVPTVRARRGRWLA